MNRISVLYGMLALGACLVCVSCGNVWKSRDRKEPVVTVERKVRYFSKIEVEYPCDVIFAQSDSLYVSVSGTRDAVNGIVTVHDGDRLVIRPKMLPGMLLPARLLWRTFMSVHLTLLMSCLRQPARSESPVRWTRTR